ncbi:MAG: hypothetical protein M1826_005810 [Phylliscum demangeonii]|nr:MAG: hypothetical protein M1826_005810 [Phylliscum demangeonii]
MGSCGEAGRCQAAGPDHYLICASERWQRMGAGGYRRNIQLDDHLTSRLPRYPSSRLSDLGAYGAAVVTYIDSANKTLMVSAFGAAEPWTERGPSILAETLAAFVLQTGLDAVDVDYEDFDTFDQNATASVDWLVSLIECLRLLLLYCGTRITMPLVAPWFSDVRFGGAFHELHPRVGRNQVASRFAVHFDGFRLGPRIARGEARRLEKLHDLTNIAPFDDPYVIAGQGTIGMEILRQTSLQNLEAIFCRIGGGGLIAGIEVYIKRIAPHLKIIGVETYDANVAVRTLHDGCRTVLNDVGLFADGRETFRLCREVVDEIIQVSTDELCAAIKDVFRLDWTPASPSPPNGDAACWRLVDRSWPGCARWPLRKELTRVWRGGRDGGRASGRRFGLECARTRSWTRTRLDADVDSNVDSDVDSVVEMEPEMRRTRSSNGRRW